MSTNYYRRGSIFWALTLIAVGSLFLYQNFNPRIHPWQVVAKYWPVLIIFWGISKLIDYFRVMRHPDEVHPSLFTGGEVILLILILIFGTLMSKIVLHPWQQWSDDFGINHQDFANLFLNSYTYTKTLSAPASTHDRLLIVNRRGDVEIHGSDRQNIDATIKETIRTDSEAEAKKVENELKVNLVNEGGQYVLKSNLDSLPHNGGNVRLDITIHLPRSTSTEITTERGDLIAESLKGDQTLTDKHGDLHAKDLDGLVRIKKEGGSTAIHGVNGSLELDGRGDDINVSDVTGTVTASGDFSGTVQFHNVAQLVRYSSSRTNLTAQKLSGQLSMDLGSLDARGLGGPLEITTRQKDITLEDFKNGIKVTDVNGDVRLRPAASPTHPIEVDLRRGNIELSLPSTSAFQIDARSDHGEVKSDFPGLTVSTSTQAPSITGTTGGGGPSIKLSTTYGTIRLLRQGPGQDPDEKRSPSPGSEARLSRRHAIHSENPQAAL